MISLQRFSFRQLLLVAFLLIASLLASACLRELFLLEHLLRQSSDGAGQALQQTADAQILTERSVDMERAARLFLVLDDQALRQRFEDAAHEARTRLQRLARSGIGPERIDEWQRQQVRISQQLLIADDAVHTRETRVMAAFRELDAINAAIAQQVRSQNEARNQQLLDQLESGRVALGRQILVAIAIAILLALVFGVWLARPLKQLETAVVALGENRFERQIEIHGPKDLRLLGRRLDWLRLRLAQLDSDQSRFLRNVSHELKTPLAALREGVALLDDGIAGTLSATQRDVIRILRQNTSVLQAQIEDLLRFNAAAFEAQRLVRRRHDLRQLVSDEVEHQRLQWQARNLRVTIDGEDVAVDVDADKLRMAVANLFSNAIRFSPAGSAVRFHIERTAESAVLRIEDEGPGVAPQDRARVFEPFFRGERQPEGAVRGSGIGLSIVYETITAHGGTLSLEDREPGAHFRIELPLPAH